MKYYITRVFPQYVAVSEDRVYMYIPGIPLIMYDDAETVNIVKEKSDRVAIPISKEQFEEHLMDEEFGDERFTDALAKYKEDSTELGFSPGPLNTTISLN